jgi:hypothetical protein
LTDVTSQDASDCTEGGGSSRPPRADRSNSTLESSKKRAVINSNSCVGKGRRATRAESLAYGSSNGRATVLDSRSHTGVRELDLSQNAMGPSGAKVIAEVRCGPGKTPSWCNELACCCHTVPPCLLASNTCAKTPHSRLVM